MKIVLVAPSNILYMPYLNNYVSILEDEGIEYSIINWDRLNIEKTSNNFTYRDKKNGPRRNFIDYYKYSLFIRRELKKVEYDKIVVFGLQLAYFLRKVLSNKFANKSIIDIRDHNKILNYYDFTQLFKSANKVVISSKAYETWLPNDVEYTLNHNTNISDLDLVLPLDYKHVKVRTNYHISFIGAIRDSNANIQLIDSLRNSKSLTLNFHGDGISKNTLEDFVKNEDISNVNFSGRYRPEEEKQLYLESDIINVLRLDSDINNVTAIPNRLYNGLLYGKPFLALSGSHLSNIISEYTLGLVVDSFENLEEEILSYLDNYDHSRLLKDSRKLLKDIIDDNDYFKLCFTDFIIGSKHVNLKKQEIKKI